MEKARAAEEHRKRMLDANAAMQMGMRKHKKGTPAWLQSGGAGAAGIKSKKPRAKKKPGTDPSCCREKERKQADLLYKAVPICPLAHR